MANYYADSSVLVKRHALEAGHHWFQALCHPANSNVIFTARLSLAEVYSALNRRKREANLAAGDYTQLAADFAVSAAEYQLIELTAGVIERARVLLERHPLRASDAIQLASALLAQGALTAHALPPLVFLTADERLLGVAHAEGLMTENPNQHT